VTDFLWGFKDGIVGVTGASSKAYLCNQFVSRLDDVFYKDYLSLLNNEAMWTGELAEKALLIMMLLIKRSL
jgi:hypothetical protein